MSRPLIAFALLLAGCGNLPDGYGLDCDESGVVCAEGLECLELVYELGDTGSYSELMCTTTCEVDEDCPVSWTSHYGAEQLECVGGVCAKWQCK